MCTLLPISYEVIDSLHVIAIKDPEGIFFYDQNNIEIEHTDKDKPT